MRSCNFIFKFEIHQIPKFEFIVEQTVQEFKIIRISCVDKRIVFKIVLLQKLTLILTQLYHASYDS